MQDDNAHTMPADSEIQEADTFDDVRLGLPSASDMAMWNCPGKTNLIRQTGKPSDSVDEITASGIRIHKARQLGVPVDLDDEELEVFHKSIAYEDRLVQDWMAAYDIKNCDQVSREERFFLHHPETMQPIASGQLDTFYLALPHALVIDRKTGFCSRLVPSNRNMQLRMQAVLLWKEYDGLQRIRVAFDKSRFDPKIPDFCDYSADDLEKSEAWIMQHLWLSQQQDAPLIPGQWCYHCPCNAICPQAGSYALLPSVVAARAVSSSVDISTMVNALKPVDLVKLWETKSTIEKILAEVVKRLKAMSTAELTALGLELGKGRAMNPIVKTKECFEYLVNTQLFPADEVWAAMEFSNGKIAEIARKDKNLSSKDAAAKWVKTALAEFMNQSTAEPPLKRI